MRRSAVSDDGTAVAPLDFPAGIGRLSWAVARPLNRTRRFRSRKFWQSPGSAQRNKLLAANGPRTRPDEAPTARHVGWKNHYRTKDMPAEVRKRSLGRRSSSDTAASPTIYVCANPGPVAVSSASPSSPSVDSSADRLCFSSRSDDGCATATLNVCRE